MNQSFQEFEFNPLRVCVYNGLTWLKPLAIEGSKVTLDAKVTLGAKVTQGPGVFVAPLYMHDNVCTHWCSQ